MQTRDRGEHLRTTMVCIDSYENGIPVGKMYSLRDDTEQRFESLSQFLLKMEHSLDASAFPQSFTAARSFAPRPDAQARGSPEKGNSTGKLATFAIKVLFRQNATWQGSISWLEGNNELSFRSALELVLLMDSALQPQRT